MCVCLGVSRWHHDIIFFSFNFGLSISLHAPLPLLNQPYTPIAFYGAVESTTLPSTPYINTSYICIYNPLIMIHSITIAILNPGHLISQRRKTQRHKASWRCRRSPVSPLYWFHFTLPWCCVDWFSTLTVNGNLGGGGRLHSSL